MLKCLRGPAAVASEINKEIAPQEAEPGNPLRGPCAICKRARS